MAVVAATISIHRKLSARLAAIRTLLFAFAAPFAPHLVASTEPARLLDGQVQVSLTLAAVLLPPQVPRPRSGRAPPRHRGSAGWVRCATQPLLPRACLPRASLFCCRRRVQGAASLHLSTRPCKRR